MQSLFESHVALVPVCAALDVKLVGGSARGRVCSEVSARVTIQLDLQFVNDSASDVVLDCEHVLHLAVITVAPKLETSLHFHKLGGDA